MRQLTIVLGISLFLVACQNQSRHNDLYYWGDYQDSVYAYFNQEDLVAQEGNLTKIIEKTKELNKPVAPGVYAQLGLVLLKQHKTSEAGHYFNLEQQLYPESAKLIQFLQNNYKKSRVGGGK